VAIAASLARGCYGVSGRFGSAGVRAPRAIYGDLRARFGGLGYLPFDNHWNLKHEQQTHSALVSACLKLKTVSDAQTAKVNALIDTKLKSLNDSQAEKIKEPSLLVSCDRRICKAAADVPLHH